jgi:hypothetical protein
MEFFINIILAIKVTCHVLNTAFELGVTEQQTKTKQTPWPETASELYRPSKRRLSAKLVQTFADRGCHVVSVTSLRPYSRFSRSEGVTEQRIHNCCLQHIGLSNFHHLLWVNATCCACNIAIVYIYIYIYALTPSILVIAKNFWHRFNGSVRILNDSLHLVSVYDNT